MSHRQANAVLETFGALVRDQACLAPELRAAGALKTGVDLGTANIVVSVVDAENRPVAGASVSSRVVRDGIVVDYLEAIRIVRDLKSRLEKMLGTRLVEAATAIPPGIIEGNVRVIRNVVEASGFEVVDVTDEPTAAARVLGVTEGAVVDVGGGTTGISILRDGRVVFVDDEATGGTHMTLVLSGALGVGFEEAEAIKTDPVRAGEVFPIIRPVVEKMAAIVACCIAGREVGEIYVVGGACSFPEFAKVLEGWTGCRIVKPAEPLLVTPLGIAMYPTGGGGS